MHPFRSIAICAALLALSVTSCHRARIIPKKKFADISVEMILTDQWLRIHQEVNKTTDTALVYEPIFRRYGFSTRCWNGNITSRACTCTRLRP